MGKTIPVSEIFGVTIEGEGLMIGTPTVYVRTGGCDYACSWCDSKHAVLPQYKDTWKSMTADEIFQELQQITSHKPLLITLSGGNPALQSFEDLLALGHAAGYRFKLETQGSIVQSWFANLDYLSLSPKPPSSGMPPRPKNATQQKQHLQQRVWDCLDECITTARQAQIYFKIPILDETDYLFAKDVASRYPDISMYLQPVNPTPEERDEANIPLLLRRMEWLVNRVTADKWYTVTVLPQLHVLIWGNKRGV